MNNQNANPYPEFSELNMNVSVNNMYNEPMDFSKSPNNNSSNPSTNSFNKTFQGGFSNSHLSFDFNNVNNNYSNNTNNRNNNNNIQHKQSVDFSRSASFNQPMKGHNFLTPPGSSGNNTNVNNQQFQGGQNTNYFDNAGIKSQYNQPQALDVNGFNFDNIFPQQNFQQQPQPVNNTIVQAQPLDQSISYQQMNNTFLSQAQQPTFNIQFAQNGFQNNQGNNGHGRVSQGGNSNKDDIFKDLY